MKDRVTYLEGEEAEGVGGGKEGCEEAVFKAALAKEHRLQRRPEKRQRGKGVRPPGAHVTGLPNVSRS